MTDDHDGRFSEESADDVLHPLDIELRALLTRIPDHPDTARSLPSAALDEIEDAISRAWPDGSPPTLEQLEQEHTDSESDDGSAHVGADDDDHIGHLPGTDEGAEPANGHIEHVEHEGYSDHDQYSDGDHS
jgi:hypothetical protein